MRGLGAALLGASVRCAAVALEVLDAASRPVAAVATLGRHGPAVTWMRPDLGGGDSSFGPAAGAGRRAIGDTPAAGPPGSGRAQRQR